jgi:hypothetical protein
MGMTDASVSHVVHHDACAGGGHAAPDVASWLGLAAAPTFTFMALWIGFFGGQPVMFCVGMQNASPLNGMVLMYALMSAFHAGPWLKLIARRRIGGRWRTFMASIS